MNGSVVLGWFGAMIFGPAGGAYCCIQLEQHPRVGSNQAAPGVVEELLYHIHPSSVVVSVRCA